MMASACWELLEEESEQRSPDLSSNTMTSREGLSCGPHGQRVLLCVTRVRKQASNESQAGLNISQTELNLGQREGNRERWRRRKWRDEPIR